MVGDREAAEASCLKQEPLCLQALRGLRIPLEWHEHWCVPDWSCRSPLPQYNGSSLGVDTHLFSSTAKDSIRQTRQIHSL